MKINMASKVIEYYDIPSLDNIKVKQPDSNIKLTYQLEFLRENTFFFLNDKIYYESKSKKYGLWKERIPLDITQPIEHVDLRGKVLLCILKPKTTRNTRIFVSNENFIFEETLKQKIVQYLSKLKGDEPKLFETIVDTLMNDTFNGPKIGKDAKDITNFFVSSPQYKFKIEDIVQDYELFKTILATEVMI